MPLNLQDDLGILKNNQAENKLGLQDDLGILQQKSPKVTTEQYLARGFNPEQLVNWAETEPNPVLKKLKQFGVVAHLGGKEMITIPAHFFNQMFMNYPRSLFNTFNIEYPEKAENKFVNLTAKTAGAVGAVKSRMLKAISTLGQGGKILEAPLRYKGLAGAATGAVYAPSEDVIGLKERTGQAITGGVLSVGIPLAMKGTQQLLKGLKKGVGYLSKSTADYVTTKIAPRAYKMYQDAIQKFTPEIQKFAEEKFKIPPSAINAIKQKGIDNINKIRVKYNNSTDLISQKILSGMQKVRNFADDAYMKTMHNAPKGKKINIEPAIDEAGNRLKKIGLITKNGNLTELGKSEIARDSVYGKLLDFYQSAKAISGVEKLQGKPLTQTQIIKVAQSERQTLVNKHQFSFLRDKLNALYKNKPSDIDVRKVVDKFYQSGESSGIKGLQQARALQRKAFEMERKFLDSKGNLKALGKEGSLGRFHKLSQDQIRQLEEIENYIGEKFVDDLSALTAGQYLDEFGKITFEGMAKELQGFVNPAYTNIGKSKYSQILGKNLAEDIFSEIIAHRRGIKLKKGILIGTGIGIAGGGTISGIKRKILNE